MIIIVIIAAAIFCARLVSWQVLSKDYYDEIALTTSTYKVSSEAIRGEIYDANGVPLAVNKTGYRIVFNKIYLKDESLNEIIVRLTTMLSRTGDKWADELPITTDSNGNYVFVEDKQEEIDILKSKDMLNMNPYSGADECMTILVEKYDCASYPKSQQRNIVSVRYNMDVTGFSKSTPYVFADNISERGMNIVSENMQTEKGVEVIATAVRSYENGTVAPHIVGVTGLISAEEYTELKSKGYAYNDEIGKSGVEAAFEKYLRGSPGSRTYEVDAEGNAKITETVASEPGGKIYLTIDSKYQKLAQTALEEAVKEANEYSKISDSKYDGEDCKGAAVVMLDVRDFSVICAASYPTYDLSKFYDDYEKLSTDKSIPLFDRAFMGALAPGSTFKPMVAAAALQEHAITTSTKITCNGIYTKGGLRLQCMGYHGAIDMYAGIRDSCNVFFAETARLLGIENMNIYAKRCGLGVKTGVEISESSGTLAGPEFSRAMGSEWYDSFVSPAGIGQSDNQFTPLQLATYAATIANDGVRLKTHVVDRVESYTGDEILLKTEIEKLDDMGVSRTNLNEVKKAMNMATNNYDALSDLKIEIAGKTGTAENAGSDHANFICFAPYDNPQVAIGVMVEHGTKSYVAINVAKKLLNEYFGLNKKEKEEEEKKKKEEAARASAAQQNEDNRQSGTAADDGNNDNDNRQSNADNDPDDRQDNAADDNDEDNNEHRSGTADDENDE